VSEEMEAAFTAYRLERPWLAPREGEDEEETTRRQAKCWTSYEAFRAGWEARDAEVAALKNDLDAMREARDRWIANCQRGVQS
jgi:hypothetical protein